MADSVSQASFSFRSADIILFSAQILLIVIVSIASIINLSLGYGNQNLWTVLLTSCMGIVMPNPRLKVKNLEDNKSRPDQKSTKVHNGRGILHDVII